MQKSAKIVFPVCVSFALLSLVAPVFLAAGTDVIGGADTPTYWYFFSNTCNGLFLWLLPLSAVAAVFSALWLFAPGWIGRLTDGRTTALVLGISAAGGCGLAAVLWCLSMALGGLRDYPVALPVSVAMGLAALTVFILLCFAYVGLRRKKSGIWGVLTDILTSILFLPGFSFFAMWAAHGLQELL